MAYTKPDKELSEFTPEELTAYETHLESQEKIRRIQELEEAQSKVTKPDPKPEDSEDDHQDVNVQTKLEDEAFKLIEKDHESSTK